MSDKQQDRDFLTRRQYCLRYIMGGKCYLCGFDKYVAALEFHHINPDEKSFTIASRWKYSLDYLAEELKKCVLLCSNCHQALHASYENVSLPIDTESTFCEDRYWEVKKANVCLYAECDKYINPSSTYCSFSCSNKHKKHIEYLESLASANMEYKNKVDWRKTDVVELLERHGYNFSAAGRELGISDNAVRKRYKKIQPTM